MTHSLAAVIPPDLLSTALNQPFTMKSKQIIYGSVGCLIILLTLWFKSTLGKPAGPIAEPTIADQKTVVRNENANKPPDPTISFRFNQLDKEIKRCRSSSEFEQLLSNNLKLNYAWTRDERAVPLFFVEWSNANPVDALNGIALLPNDFRGRVMRGQALRAMKNVYADRPEQVLEACKLLNNDDKRSVMSSVIRLMSSKGKEPQKALAYILENHGLGTIRKSLLSTLFDEWSTHDPDSARQVASSLPYPEERAAAHSTISELLKRREHQQKLMQEAGIIE